MKKKSILMLALSVTLASGWGMFPETGIQVCAEEMDGEVVQQEEMAVAGTDVTDPVIRNEYDDPEAEPFVENGEVEFESESEAEEFFDTDTLIAEEAAASFLSEENMQTETSEFVLSVEEGTDLTASLNELLYLAGQQATDEKPCKVIIPPGNYQLTGTINMYSNLHLYAVGAVITKTSSTKHILLRLGNTQESAGGYDGYRNITIEGGVWDCNYDSVENKTEGGGYVGFRIGHASHVVVKDVTFLNNLKSHFLELAGVKDCLVTGCTFRGYWKEYELADRNVSSWMPAWTIYFPNIFHMMVRSVKIFGSRIMFLKM